MCKEVGGRHVARMRTAPHDVRRSHEDPQARGVRGPRGFDRRRELGQGDAQGGPFADMRERGVVVGGHRDAGGAAEIRDEAAVRTRMGVGFGDAATAEGREGVVGQVHLALVVGPVGFEVDELALAGAWSISDASRISGRCAIASKVLRTSGAETSQRRWM